MERAPDHCIIARRNLAAVTARAGEWKPVAGAPMTIGQAQDAYDRGEIELAQGRDGDAMLLFAIPRVHRDAGRRPWFGRREAA